MIRKYSNLQNCLAVTLATALLGGQVPAKAQTAARSSHLIADQQTEKAQKSTQYFAPLQNIPVMPALEPVEDAASVFDKPGGRIVQVRATSHDVGIDDIRAYYAQTLPALGWQQHRQDSYVRGGEKLTLEISRDEERVILDLQLKPRTDTHDRK